MRILETSPLSGKILINAGPSARGWSRIGKILHCLQFVAWTSFAPAALAKAGRSDEHAKRIDAIGRGGQNGSILHVGLAHHYARIGARQPGGFWHAGVKYTDPEAFHDPETAMMLVEHEHPLGELSTTLKTLRAYVKRYAGREWKRILHVEDVFEARIPVEPHEVGVWDFPIGPNGEFLPPVKIGVRTVTEYPYSARLDFVAENMGGQVMVVDNKSTGRIEAKHPKAYSMHGQLLGQRWLAHQVYGNRFGGFVLNMVQTTEPHKFERPTLDPAPALLNRFPSIVRDAERRLERMLDEGRPLDQWTPVASEQGCYGRYGLCPAARFCQWGPGELLQALAAVVAPEATPQPVAAPGESTVTSSGSDNLGVNFTLTL